MTSPVLPACLGGSCRLLLVLLAVLLACQHCGVEARYKCEQVQCPGSNTSVCDAACQASQRSDLESLYTALGGPQWTDKTLWLNSSAHHCTWAGVGCCLPNGTVPNLTSGAQGNADGPDVSKQLLLGACCCNVTGAVVSLALNYNGLFGELATASIGALAPTLKHFLAGGNAVMGTLPTNFSAFPDLNTLNLDRNLLSGVLPPELGNMSNLIVLRLGYNIFEGRIPPEYSRLRQLEWLEMPANFIDGVLPLPLLLLPSIKAMDLSENGITGSFEQTPAEEDFAGRTECDTPSPELVLNLQNNALNGSIPGWFRRLNLRVLIAGNNNLSGNLPSFCPETELLRLNDNLLTGSLPAALGGWETQEVDVSNNQLTGSIPFNLGLMSNLVVLRLNHNGFSGALPESFSNLVKLQMLDIRDTLLQIAPVVTNGGVVTNTSVAKLYQTPLAQVDPNTALASRISAIGDGSADVVVLNNTDILSSDAQLPFCMSFDQSNGRSEVAKAGDGVRYCYPVLLTSGDGMLLLDARFFMYKDCTCAGGQVARYTQRGGTVDTMECLVTVNNSSKTLLLSVLVPVAVASIVLLALGVILWKTALQAMSSYKATQAKKSPPGPGQQVTLVLTDVQGSTELWEWDAGVMGQALELHDRLLRSYMPKFCGYEVTTEGDAFLVAFHDPVDAAGWCLAVQLALNAANWQPTLLQHPKAAELLVTHGDGSSSISGSKHSSSGIRDTASSSGSSGSGASTVLFRGLRVRMGIATGAVEGLRRHKVTDRAEYGGQVLRRVQAVADTPDGGQVVMCGDSFRALQMSLPDMAATVVNILGPLQVPQPMQYNAEPEPQQDQGRASPQQQPLEESVQGIVRPSGQGIVHRSHPRRSSICLARSMDWRPEMEAAMARRHAVDGGDDSSKDDITSFDGREAPLASHYRRVMWQSSSGLEDAPAVDGTAAVVSDAGVHVTVGTVSKTGIAGMAAADQAHFKEAGQGPKKNSFAASSPTSNGHGMADNHQGIMVVDMGTHRLPGLGEPLHIMQALPPGLEDRALTFGPLSTLQQKTPGYFDAPATRADACGFEVESDGAAEGTGVQAAELPEVTLVFCAVEGYADMQAANRVAAECMIQQYADVVRWTLLVCCGYECQENEGSYMVAFAKAPDAIEWCLLVQETLLAVNWSHEILELPGAGEEINAQGSITFRGPRVRAGVCRGRPTRVVPHTSTGRADYFGPLVNRAARFCHAAAWGGQVVVPSDIIEEMAREWCNIDIDALLRGDPELVPGGSEGPPWQLQALVPQQNCPVQCWAASLNAFDPQPAGDGLQSDGVSSTRAGSSRMLSRRVSDAAVAHVAAFYRTSSTGSEQVTLQLQHGQQQQHGQPQQQLEPDQLTQHHQGQYASARNSIEGYPGHLGSLASRQQRASQGSMGSVPASPHRANLQQRRLSRASMSSARPDQRTNSSSSNVPRATMLHASASMKRTTMIGAASGLPMGAAAMPDISTLFMLRQANSPYTASQSGKGLPSRNGMRSNGGKGRKGPGRSGIRASSSMGGMVPDGTTLDCGLAAVAYSRVALHKWLWAGELLVHELGQFRFKGVQGVTTLTSINTAVLGTRTFPRPRKGKGEQVAPGRGLLLRLVLEQAHAMRGSAFLAANSGVLGALRSEFGGDDAVLHSAPQALPHTTPQALRSAYSSVESLVQDLHKGPAHGGMEGDVADTFVRGRTPANSAASTFGAQAASGPIHAEGLQMPGTGDSDKDMVDNPLYSAAASARTTRDSAGGSGGPNAMPSGAQPTAPVINGHPIPPATHHGSNQHPHTSTEWHGAAHKQHLPAVVRPQSPFQRASGANGASGRPPRPATPTSMAGKTSESPRAAAAFTGDDSGAEDKSDGRPARH